MTKSSKMVRLRELRGEDVIEVPGSTPARSIDAMLYLDTLQVKYIGEEMPIEVMRAFSVVELVTGFEEAEGTKSVMVVPPSPSEVALMSRC
jgi:hypothetical protein